ncbi:MAG TPA: ROK family protein, partial [Planctomycetaceae bacterium]
ALGEYAVRSRAVHLQSRPERQQSGTSVSSLFMVIVGTGLGGGAVHDGRVVVGRQGRAGHVGHTTLPPHAFRHEHDRQLLVGNSFCTAESAISLKALTHQLEYRLTLDQWQRHLLHGVSGSTRDKAKRLRGLAAEGDALALELFEDQAQALGIALLNANYLGDYDLLVIGGGVCDLAPPVRDSYRRTAWESYRQHALDGFKAHVEMEFSVCGDDAPVIGALAWVYDNDL